LSIPQDGSSDVTFITTDLSELFDRRDRLLRERVASLEIGTNPTHQHLLACATEIAPVAGLLHQAAIGDPVRNALSQIVALTGEAPIPAYARRNRLATKRHIGRVHSLLGPDGESIPLRDPLNRPWTPETFFVFVAGVLYEPPVRQVAKQPTPPPAPTPSRWQFGPNADRVWGHRRDRRKDIKE
jgi:hypothetical protein